MKVKAKKSNRFLIKDEWYEVISTNQGVCRNEKLCTFNNGGYYQLLKGSTPGRTIHYELVNHTHKRWNTSWYHETNFYTLEEVRDMKLNQILQKENFL
jgi:hypothetical protein